ncbi:hypothetical protein [Thermoanaerobacter thermocopriae]|nr:hypothetical protein [Thermoanaerobacter thermocopriae]
MFITHLAMSIKRLKEEEKLESTIDDELLTKLKILLITIEHLVFYKI